MHEWLYVGIAALSVSISLGWIWVFASCGCNPADAGKGGAIGVAASFGMFFGRRNYARIISSTHAEIKKLAARIEAIAQSTAVDETSGKEDAEEIEEIVVIEASNAAAMGSQAFQNILLSISSVIGTLAWGFGDWAAELIRSHHLLVCK